ncbi:hypothetical protein SIPHO049v1_p0023 [Vibrio phage PS14A.1]|nr:hypothetical protein SIPHO049v1_p0023 [Vibrio phage PS14A.1]
MNKLLVLLALLSTTATASDWTLQGNIATTGDLNQYSAVATLFVTEDDKTAVGFSLYDPTCEDYDPELKAASIHLVNEQPVKFQYQCIDKAEKLFMAEYNTGRRFIINEFLNNKTVAIKSLGSNYLFSYSSTGFADAYKAIRAIAQISKKAI